MLISDKAEATRSGRAAPVRMQGLLDVFQPAAARFDAGRRAFLVFDRFDRRVASAMSMSMKADTFYAFTGAAKRSFLRGKELGFLQFEFRS